MTEHKFTDEEVIKALECCKDANCLNCPRWSEEWYSGQCADFLPSVLDIINRQKAEIEELKIRNERQKHTINVYQINETRTEAIKEFVGLLETVEEVVVTLNDETITAVDTFHIHRIAKKIIGEQK